MTSRGRDLQRPLDLLLPLDLVEIGVARRRELGSRAILSDRRLPCKVCDHLEQRSHGQNASPLGQRRLGRIAGRQHESPSRGPGLQRHSECAAHLPHLAGKRKLAGKFVARERFGCQLPARRKQAERDRQIKAAGILGQIRRCQVNGDATGREFEPGVIQRRPHAILGLAHLGVGQPDNVECRQAWP